MDPPPAPAPSSNELASSQTSIPSRSQSFSAKSDDSQTAAEFINSQLQLEADAREALPYKFENCTKTIGKLRQSLFSCLTCNPPPSNPADPYTPAGVCYSCSIQCHGEHTLVELFNKRQFVCDCGTTRLPATSPCTIRVNPETNTKGGVHSEEPARDNKYNHNFRNSFCGCECDYDPHQQKGTMFQCLGLGTAETGGCGEDWWHPGCVVGLRPDWFESSSQQGDKKKAQYTGLLPSITEVAENVVGERIGETAAPNEPPEMEEDEDDDPPLPPGFPQEDDFEGFICYKCVEAHPWIKRYAGAPGFLAPVFLRSMAPSPERGLLAKTEEAIASHLAPPKKRKAEDDVESVASDRSKRVKGEVAAEASAPATTSTDTSSEAQAVKPAEEKPICKFDALPPAPAGQMSLFFKADFRDHLCHCSDCFPLLKPHDQLIEEEIIYEPSLSSSEEEAGGSTVGSGSIYDRGESALKNVDRVRAIEGVMAFNHLKDKLKPLFQQFAGTGKAISAEDIKAHFAKMRGDDEAIKAAGESAKNA
ncbi:hypothetical protein BDZ45DRAFT_656981 [Acephala macrosclerotiorum]|nr:hypothetical protein BDZ45DRAFT_656981 [Acephala macrosclerotiorum]